MPALRLAPLLLLLTAAPALANMASPVQPGAPAGEPAAALDGLRIARETLTLDLRPLGLGQYYALVEAVYRVVNPGEARRVPLEFVALGEDVDAAGVWLDGQPVAATAVGELDVPALWRIADRTPALDAGAPPYETYDGVDMASGLRFEVEIPPGQHTIRVAYRVDPGTYDTGDHPNKIWQLAYSLAPARLWAGFGQLDVAVIAPAGWDVATSLPLRRDGDRLVGRFPGVPGDVLAVSARAPTPTLRTPLRLLTVAVAALLVVFVGVVSGALAARAGRSAWAALPGALLAGVLAAAALVIGLATADDLGDSSAHGYGTLLGMIFVGGPLAVVGGAALAQGLAWWTVRRGRRAPAAD